MSSRTSPTAAAARAALVALVALAISACGADAGPDTAADAAPTTSGTESSTPTPTAPTIEPEPGSLPDFAYADYAYTLQLRCYCPDDLQYAITVTGGELTEITWATDGRGHQAGDPVDDEYASLTIQDVIDEGNDPDHAEVDVEWPAGQAWPDSVYVDADANAIDEEVTYVISDVQIL